MDEAVISPQDPAIETEPPQASRAQSIDGKKKAEGPTIYIHNGSHEQIPADAPPALQFLKSYTRLVDGPKTPLRAKHISPRATLRINGGEPAPVRRLATVLEARSELIPAMHFEHTLRRVWAISETTPSGPKETLLVHWLASATHLRRGSASGADFFDRTEQQKFTVLELEPAPPGKGVHGLWLVESNNWMDGLLYEKVQEKVLLAVLKDMHPEADLVSLLKNVEADPGARAELFEFCKGNAPQQRDTLGEDVKSEEDGEVSEEGDERDPVRPGTLRLTVRGRF